jgi:malonyl CoA-acyl carrier protein transacylase
MQGGKFQIARNIFDNSLWHNVTEFRLFFLICGKAMFTDGIRIGDIVLKRGQWIRSIRNLQQDLEYIENNSVKRYPISTLHRAVENLVKDERINKFDTKLGTLFEVVNYNSYQCFSISDTQALNKDGTTLEQQPNNNKNVMNDKNVNKKSFCPESDEVKLSLLLLEKMKLNNPTCKEPNIQVWAKSIDKLIRIDSKSVEEITRVINWCQKDNFWSKNILSTEKLRARFDQLILKSNPEVKETKKSSPQQYREE